MFNYGKCKKKITYIEDIKIVAKPPKKEVGEDGLSILPYVVYNIGNSNPESLLNFVKFYRRS